MILDTASLHALDITSGSITYNNLEADTCTLTREYFGNSPLSYGDDLTITRKGKIIFNGRVSSVTLSTSASSATETIEVLNEVGWLNLITYSEPKTTPPHGYMQKLIVALPESPDIVDDWQDLVNDAEAEAAETLLGVRPLDELLAVPYSYSGCRLTLDAQTGLSGINYTPSGQDSCFSIMSHLARQHPSVRAIVDYSRSSWEWALARDLDTITLDASTGVFSTADYCKKINSITVTPRHDLQYPAVCLTGGVIHSIGGTADTEGAYIYHVNESDLYNTKQDIANASRNANKQRMHLKATRLPPSRYQYSDLAGKVFDKFLADDKTMLEFLTSIEGLQILEEVQSCVKVGDIGVELIPASILYPIKKDSSGQDIPPDDIDDVVPHNYMLPTEGGYTTGVYMLRTGDFPASPDPKQCVWGLRWCKAKLRIKMAIFAIPPQSTNIEALLELFPSRGVVNGIERQVSYIEVDVILINKQKASYYPIDNSLATNDPDYSQWREENPEEEPLTKEQLIAYAEELYIETRQLVYDGSITIEDCDISPTELLNSKLSVVNVTHLGTLPASPVQSISLDLATNNMTVTTGSKDPLGIPERIDLFRTTRASLQESLTDSQNPRILFVGGAEGKLEREAFTPTTIQPQITATVIPIRPARESAQPFTVFRERVDGENKVFFKGGKVSTLTGDLELEDTDITAQYREGQTWYVEQVFIYSSRTYELRIKYKNND